MRSSRRLERQRLALLVASTRFGQDANTDARKRLRRLVQNVQTIGGEILVGRLLAEPVDLHAIDLPRVTDTEVQSRSIVTLITSATVQFDRLRFRAAGNRHFGSHTVSIESFADQLKLNPMFAKTAFG